MTSHGELFTESFGDSSDSAYLLIAGAGSSSRFWTDFFCKELSKQKTFVIRFDHRDTGLSSKGKEPYFINDLANDILDILDEYQIKKADLVGYSMGGYISQYFAFFHPHRLRSITSISAGPVAPTPTTDTPLTEEEKKQWDDVWKVMSSNRPNQNFEQSLPGYLLVYKYLHGSHPLDEHIVKNYVRDFFVRSKHEVGVSAPHLEVMRNMLDTMEERRGFWKKVNVPITLIHGEEDNLVTPKRGSLAVKEALPQANLHIIPKMGHMIFHRNLEKAILDIIDQV